MSLFVGETDLFKVTANYSDETTKNVTYDCVYVSNDPTIAKVLLLGPNDYQKSVEAVAEGTATITISYKEGEVTEEALVTVTVCAVELDHIVVLPEAMTLYYGGGERESASQTIESITAYNNDGTEFEVDFVADCTFGLNPVGIVTVTDDEVTADKVGKTTLTVTYEGKTDAIEVEVLVLEVDYIVVEPETMNLIIRKENFEAIESVTAHYNDGTEDDEIGFGDYTYGLYPTGIVDITDAEVTGLVTAEAVGETTITIIYEGKTDTIEVIVTHLPMEIIADDVLTFTKDEVGEFTMGIVANSDIGKTALAYFTLPTEDEAEVWYWEVAEEDWKNLLYFPTHPDIIFGDPNVPLGNFTFDFRATFIEAGTYPILVEVWEWELPPPTPRVWEDAEKDELLGYKLITFEVVEAEID
ncbi:hypothetical protein ES705_47211 [subsurface metagenome]